MIPLLIICALVMGACSQDGPQKTEMDYKIEAMKKCRDAGFEPHINNPGVWETISCLPKEKQ